MDATVLASVPAPHDDDRSRLGHFRVTACVFGESCAGARQETLLGAVSRTVVPVRLGSVGRVDACRVGVWGVDRPHGDAVGRIEPRLSPNADLASLLKCIFPGQSGVRWRAGLYAGFCTGLAPGGGHPSRPAVARRLQRPTRGTCGRAARPSAWPCSGWGLPSRPGRPGRWCALTAPFHPCLCRPGAAIGGLFSVALSCGSPRLGVTQHPALWSPDVPRTGHHIRGPVRGRPADSPPKVNDRPGGTLPPRGRKSSDGLVGELGVGGAEAVVQEGAHGAAVADDDDRGEDEVHDADEDARLVVDRGGERA